MLKIVLPLFLLIKLNKSWGAMQVGLFMVGFLTSVMCMHDFGIYCLGFNLGMDFLSYILVMLSVWIVALVVLASQKINKEENFSSSFLTTNMMLLLALVVTFSSMDYLLFYISFEASLIPTLILILGWGYQPERIQAGIYMLFYTLFLSLPLLVSLLSLYNLGGSLIIGMSSISSVEFNTEVLWYFSTIMAFMVKLPLYLFHLWLPKAHVEAPMAGSMILAGVLLKLGGYGLIRVLMIFRSMSFNFSWLWVSVSLIGGFMISLVCLRQVENKSLIAYSSMAHTGAVLCGLVVFNWWGVTGAVVVMVGHGLCSSGLFCLANMVYERVGSRSLMVSKGLLNFMPSMGLWWFVLSIGNMAAPPSLNLLGEISLIVGMMSWSCLTMLGIMLVSFFSAAYTLYMYSLSQHGVFYSSIYSCCSGKVCEYLVLSLHWIPLNILILNSTMVMI
uniref:NADH-ubiquinone oxidoreductase chain 4 n=1 Tax=Umalia orientalis TaxID=1603554 RepID=A0A0D3QFT1_9EUCA|nr:NADH dehydrogenase subunit 4 [Umalia orientalis]AJF14610.1 NADH dehydrogenase subunit 4 [Umalia orientalis]